MARKVIEVTIADEGRDKGKHFLITEMPASQGERWARHAVAAVSRSGVDLPPNVIEMGMAGAFLVGFKLIAGVGDSDELMAQLMACVKFVANPAMPELARALVEDDTEEITTRVKLAKEVFDLHNFFSIADVLFPQASA